MNVPFRCFAILALVLLLVPVAAAAESPSPPQDSPWRVFGDKLPAEVDALRWNIEACLAWSQKRTDPESMDQWQKQREQVAAGLHRALGMDPPPEKTPLEAKVLERTERKDYTLENVVFQSLPGFYVTCNVYIPNDVARPMPAMVITAGHAMKQGKNYDLYRTAQLGLVRHGFLVLAYDPIGQGERRLPGYSHAVSYPALLTGKSNLHYMTWDSIRALDYLRTRDEVDPKRIGIAGNSGGGLNTMYTLPIEPRFAAGGTFCCLCSYEAWIRDGGNHCICNHLPGICRVLEQFELVGVAAPRPHLAGAGKNDSIFPIEGVRETIERGERIYAFYDAKDRLALAEADKPHGWTQPLREAAYGWFCKWLKGEGDGAPIAEPEIPLDDWQSPHLMCYPDGTLPENAKSYVDLVREESERLATIRPAVPEDKGAAEAWACTLQEKLWSTFGGKPEPVGPAADDRGHFNWQGHEVRRLAIQTESDLKVPAVFVRPKEAEGATPAVVLLDDAGKSQTPNSPVAKALLGRGIAVLAVDPRAIGEVKVHANHCASDSVVLGRPLLAQQAWDVICAADYLAARDDVDAAQIGLCARGEVGLIAALAAAWSDMFIAVAIDGAPGSYVGAIADPPPLPLWAYAPNLLKVADVPELLAAAAPRPLCWINPTNVVEPVSQTEADRLAGPVKQAYRAHGRAEGARVAAGVDDSAGAIGEFFRAALR
jgi:cephalosporin-C deacetylase-like acetyl esterase